MSGGSCRDAVAGFALPAVAVEVPAFVFPHVAGAAGGPGPAIPPMKVLEMGDGLEVVWVEAGPVAAEMVQLRWYMAMGDSVGDAVGVVGADVLKAHLPVAVGIPGAGPDVAAEPADALASLVEAQQ